MIKIQVFGSLPTFTIPGGATISPTYLSVLFFALCHPELHASAHLQLCKQTKRAEMERDRQGQLEAILYLTEAQAQNVWDWGGSLPNNQQNLLDDNNGDRSH